MLEHLTADNLTMATIAYWQIKAIDETFGISRKLSKAPGWLIETAIKKFGSKAGENLWNKIAKDRTEAEKKIQNAIDKAAKRLRKDKQFADVYKIPVFSRQKPFYKDRDFVNLLIAS